MVMINRNYKGFYTHLSEACALIFVVVEVKGNQVEFTVFVQVLLVLLTLGLQVQFVLIIMLMELNLLVCSL